MIGECVLAAATLSTSLLSPQWDAAVDRAIKFWERREIQVTRVVDGGDITITEEDLGDERAGVAFLRSQRIQLTTGARWLSKRERTLTVAHEIGHVIGYHEHSDDPNNLMYPILLGGSKVEPKGRCASE